MSKMKNIGIFYLLWIFAKNTLLFATTKWSLSRSRLKNNLHLPATISCGLFLMLHINNIVLNCSVFTGCRDFSQRMYD
jgi:hypothetical protein